LTAGLFRKLLADSDKILWKMGAA